MKATEWTEAFASGKMDDKLSLLYGNAKATLEQQRQRYVDAIQAFTELYPEREDLYIYSAEPKSAATTPTTSMDVCWLQQSIWMQLQLYRFMKIK